MKDVEADCGGVAGLVLVLPLCAGGVVFGLCRDLFRGPSADGLKGIQKFWVMLQDRFVGAVIGAAQFAAAGIARDDLHQCLFGQFAVQLSARIKFFRYSRFYHNIVELYTHHGRTVGAEFHKIVDFLPVNFCPQYEIWNLDKGAWLHRFQ